MSSVNTDPGRGYRGRIYDRYVSAFKGSSSPVDLRNSAERQFQFFDHLLAPVLRPLPESVLEVGCGPGVFLYWAERRGVTSLQGIDLSVEQVAAAQSIGVRASVATFQEYLPQFDRSFDLVVGFDLIEHLTRDEAFEFLELSLTALRPSGRLMLTTPNGAGLRPGPVWYGDLTHETIYSPKTIRLALELSGYDSVTVSEIAPPPTTFRSRIRRALWGVVRLIPMAVDTIETGTAASGVYSRNMLVVARRPASGD